MTNSNSSGEGHTKGPWDYTTGRTLHHVQTDRDSPLGFGTAICSVPKSHEADARLIASAPDLLRALKDARSTLAQSKDRLERFGKSTCEIDLVLSLTDAALSKAEGR